MDLTGVSARVIGKTNIVSNFAQGSGKNFWGGVSRKNGFFGGCWFFYLRHPAMNF
jgi:hypothetical protein